MRWSLVPVDGGSAANFACRMVQSFSSTILISHRKSSSSFPTLVRRQCLLRSSSTPCCSGVKAADHPISYPHHSRSRSRVLGMLLFGWQSAIRTKATSQYVNLADPNGDERKAYRIGRPYHARSRIQSERRVRCRLPNHHGQVRLQQPEEL